MGLSSISEEKVLLHRSGNEVERRGIKPSYILVPECQRIMSMGCGPLVRLRHDDEALWFGYRI
jgi:hypothetical protein